MPRPKKAVRNTASQQNPANKRAAAIKDRRNSNKESMHPQAKKTKSLKERSKSATVLDLLKKPSGASLTELAKATAWQNHSVRGFLSGTVKKRMGLTVTSAKADKGERRYKLEQA